MFLTQYWSKMKHSQNPHRAIIVNGRFLSQRITGVQRYAFEVMRSLDLLLSTKAVEPIPLTIAVPHDAAPPTYSCIHVQKVGRLTGQMWEQTELPAFAADNLLFTPCGGAPILHKPHVITIHDAGPFSTPSAYARFYRNYYKLLQRYTSRTACHVLTVSEFSKRELIQALGIPEHKISVTYLSGEHILRQQADPTILPRHGLKRGAYALAVGSRNPNKNLVNVARAAQLLADSAIDIVVAGGGNSTIFRNLDSPSTSIKELGFVTDSELRSLYDNAGCFVFPSLYEGFGLPPLEALTAGCPIILSRCASLPEVFGKIASYCDPHSPSEIASQIRRVLLHGERPARNDCLDYASHFTWARCAVATWSKLLEMSRRTGFN